MICSKCKQDKHLSDYYVRNDGKRKRSQHYYCKTCFNVYCKERWTNKKKKAIEYKGNKCVDCHGKFDYYLYDFHHLNRVTKEFDWAKLRLFSWNRIQNELDKCVLLCCMCHRIREHKIGAEPGI